MRIFGLVASPLKWVSALATFVLLNAALVGPAAARDRPGTPNQESLTVCTWLAYNYRPLLCAIFHNTASEKVHFEMEATRNGAPYAIDPATMT